MTDWYKIENKAGKRTVIQIYGFIGDSWDSESVSAKKFFKEVNGLDADEIELHINSPGGSVFDGFAIYNLLKAHKAAVEVIVDGLAGSIASVIAMSGDTVEMPENAMMMVHDPSGLVWGNSADMRKMAEALDKMKAGIISAYRDKTGLDEKKLAGLMTDETWITAKEARLLGFADRITGQVEIEACADPHIFNRFFHTPAYAMNIATGHQPKSQTEVKEMPLTLAILKKDHQDIVAALLEEAITVANLTEKHPDIIAELTASAVAEGAAAERERIQAVLAQSMPGHEQLVNELAFDGKTTAEQAAVQILAAEKKIRDSVKDKLGSDAIKPVDHAVPPAADPKPEDDKTLPVDERAKAKWDKSPDVRNEFDGDYDAFLAYFRANEKGRVRILGGKK